MTKEELRELIQEAKQLMVNGDCFDTESHRDQRHKWFTQAFAILSGVQYHLQYTDIDDDAK